MTEQEFLDWYQETFDMSLEEAQEIVREAEEAYARFCEIVRRHEPVYTTDRTYPYQVFAHNNTDWA